jgi:uncharacterized membrane protein
MWRNNYVIVFCIGFYFYFFDAHDKLKEMRPRIKVVPTSLDKMLDTASAVLLIAMWVFTIYSFIEMPETIPTHYNLKGEVDDYGSKMTILILPFITSILFVALTWLNKYPHIFNYPTEITEVNAERQYTMATRMLRFMKLALVMIFSEIVVSTYLITQGVVKGTGIWIIPVELLIIAVPMIVVFIQAGKNKEQR